MGFASYLEDIVERLTDDLSSLRSCIRGTGRKGKKRSAGENQQHAEKLLALCEEALQQLQKEMEVVTDPTIDFASRIKTLEREVESKSSKIRSLSSEVKSKDETIQGLRDEIEAKVRHATTRERELRAEIVELRTELTSTKQQRDRLEFELSVKRLRPEQIKKEEHVQGKSIVLAPQMLKPEDLQMKFGRAGKRPTR